MELNSSSSTDLSSDKAQEIADWQLAEIEAGLAEAERGDFATPEEVAAVFAKYLFPTKGRAEDE